MKKLFVLMTAATLMFSCGQESTKTETTDSTKCCTDSTMVSDSTKTCCKDSTSTDSVAVEK